MKTLAFFALLLTAARLFADDPRIAEGIALHDQRKFDEAIAKYKAVLADSPGDLRALSELAYSYEMKGDYAACRAALDPVADKKDRLQPVILATLGNCLDLAGDSNGAIATYRKGLKVAPEDTQLLYNLAVALAGEEKYAEARELLKKELVLRPHHPGGHYLLGQIFQTENFRAPAILEYLRVLAVETGTPRAADAAKRLHNLLNLGVEKKNEGEINITIDPKTRKEEGDFQMWETTLALSSGARFTEESKKLSEFEVARTHLVTALRMLLETPAKGRNYTVQQNLPFFADLEKRKLLDVFAGIAMAGLGLAGENEWGQANQAGVHQYAEFVGTLPQ